jgi:membrane protease subunit HflK
VALAHGPNAVTGKPVTAIGFFRRLLRENGMKSGSDDPWGRRPQHFPDWEEILSKLPDLPNFLKAGLPVYIGIAVLLVWLTSGIYTIQPGEEGVVTRFGEIVRTTTAGLNYHLPWPVEQVYKVDIARIRRLEIGFRSNPARPDLIRRVPAESLMLTGDENIVDAQLTVQYRVKDPKRYLFKLLNPVSTLRAATEVALRNKVGNTTIEEVLTVGRDRVQNETQEFLQQLMDAYESGIQVTEVKLQMVEAPTQVKDAFDEVVRAREDREKLINEARGYREDVIPKARGEAQQIVEAAEAYKQERTLKAKGDAAHFNAVLHEYQKAPEVTRERLHLETIERILPNVEKVIIDSKGANNVVPLLPLQNMSNSQKALGGEE